MIFKSVSFLKSWLSSVIVNNILFILILNMKNKLKFSNIIIFENSGISVTGSWPETTGRSNMKYSKS